MLRPFSHGQFDLQIDGQSSYAYVKSVEGGFVKQNTTEESLGAMVEQVKHGTTLEVDPLKLELGIAQSKVLLNWIAQSWNRRYERKIVDIVHADYNFEPVFSRSFTECLLEEVSFPALDAKSKDGAYVKLTIRPETVDQKFEGGPKLRATTTDRQKVWSPANFRLVLDDIDTEGVTKIDAFSIKQGVKPVPAGPFRLPQIEPTSIKFPDLTITQSLAHAKSIHAWYQQIVRGDKDTDQKSGAIEFLNQRCDKVLFRIKLKEVGLKSWVIPRNESGKDEVSSCQYVLYLGGMEIDTDNDPILALE